MLEQPAPGGGLDARLRGRSPRGSGRPAPGRLDPRHGHAAPTDQPAAPPSPPRRRRTASANAFDRRRRQKGREGQGMPSIILDLEQQVHHASESAPKPRRLSDQPMGEMPSARSQIACSSRRSRSPSTITPRSGAGAATPWWPAGARRTGCLAMASRHSGFCRASRFRTGGHSPHRAPRLRTACR